MKKVILSIAIILVVGVSFGQEGRKDSKKKENKTMSEIPSRYKNVTVYLEYGVKYAGDNNSYHCSMYFYNTELRYHKNELVLMVHYRYGFREFKDGENPEEILYFSITPSGSLTPYTKIPKKLLQKKQIDFCFIFSRN